MFTPITFPSALFFWLSYKNSYELVPQNNSFPDLYLPFNKDSFLSAIQDYDIPFPIHIMVPKSSQRSQGKLFVCHLMPRSLPDGSFINLSGTVQIISPELCFVLAANYLSIPQLAVLACDLCGIYVPDDDSEFGQVNRYPVTTVNKIETYIKKAKKIQGIKKARKAIAFALDRSNSPMESKLSVAAILSYLYGGYSLEHPVLNYYVDLSDRTAEMLHCNQLCCDIVWPDKKVIVEYDSDLVHLSKQRFYKDKNRTMALNASGYTVLNVTYDSLRNTSSVDSLFMLITKSIGKRIRPDYYEATQVQRRNLIKDFFLTPGSMNWLSMFATHSLNTGY